MEFKELKQVGFEKFLSSFGKRIFLPQGIFYWSGRAKKEASINATVGSARSKRSAIYDDGDDTIVTCHLPSVKKRMGDLEIEEVFPYSPIPGQPALRQAWKKLHSAQSG